MASVESGKEGNLIKPLADTVRRLSNKFDLIPHDRKNLLRELTQFVETKISKHAIINLNFICTHNSRRSHMAQLWAQAAACYYRVPGIATYSGGTEATAFNPRAVDTMIKVGFLIKKTSEGQNPFYDATFSSESPPLRIFSKRYDDPFNPSKDFAAIMTCSHANENCPIVFGAAKRIAITYEDPKDFDGTSREEEQYMERALQIGREMLFAFSEVRVRV